MKNVLIVYASTRGYTKRLAQAHAEGVLAAACDAVLRNVEDATLADLQRANALILGTPIHMGTADWRVKRFIDTVCAPMWRSEMFLGKVGGVFATGGGFGGGGGGADLCLVGMFSMLAQLGMLMTPLPPNAPGFARGGTAWGPYVRTQDESLEYVEIDTMPVETGIAHGHNVAQLSAVLDGRWLNKPGGAGAALLS